MGCIHRSSLNLQCYLHSQRTNRFRNRDRSSFHRMDEFLHCFHNPSNRILRSNHHCHHCIHSHTSRSCFRMELMNCIHNLRSIRCSHCRIQVLRMGIHIHNRCMGCIHRSSLNLQCYLHSQRTSKLHNRDHSSFHRMDDFLHCFHNPSNHILRSNHHFHHCIHSRTSRSCFRMELMNCIHNLRSIRCSHCHIQVLRMGIHIHNRCMGCIHQSSLNLQCCLHSSHRSTSTNHHRVGCLMSIRNLRSIRCSHCRIQVHHMGIRIHNRCMGCIHQSSLSLQCYHR